MYSDRENASTVHYKRNAPPCTVLACSATNGYLLGFLLNSLSASFADSIHLRHLVSLSLSLSLEPTVKTSNMSDVIDDPTVWCPQGQTIKKDSSDTRNGDEIVFAMGTQDMGALNRFINGARPLPTERDSYCTSLGILDQSKLTPKIWTEADAVIAEYTAVSGRVIQSLAGFYRIH